MGRDDPRREQQTRGNRSFRGGLPQLGDSRNAIALRGQQIGQAHAQPRPRRLIGRGGQSSMKITDPGLGALASDHLRRRFP
jgi:hypothetical protein